MKTFLLFSILVVIFLNSHAQQNDCGNNASFEIGTINGWIASYGSYGGGCPVTTGKCPEYLWNLTSGGTLNPGGLNAPLTSPKDRHTMVTMAFNGNALDSISLNKIYVVPPGGGSFAFRLGNAVARADSNVSSVADAESIKLSVMVTYQNAGFVYRYAAFLQDGGHIPEQQPRFEIIIRDANNNLIPCGNYKVVAGKDTGCYNTSKFHPGAGTGTNQWYYSDWTTVGLDLTGYIGQAVTIEFRTADCMGGTAACSAGGHSAYAYIDCYCSPITVSVPLFCVTPSVPLTICAPPGYASYKWATSDTGQCITIKNPIPGTIYTVNMTSVTGCPTTTTVRLAGPDLQMPPNTKLCLNKCMPLVAKSASALTYSWSPTVGLSDYSIANPVACPSQNITYFLTVTDGNGCKNTGTVNITVDKTCVPFDDGPDTD